MSSSGSDIPPGQRTPLRRYRSHSSEEDAYYRHQGSSRRRYGSRERSYSPRRVYRSSRKENTSRERSSHRYGHKKHKKARKHKSPSSPSPRMDGRYAQGSPIHAARLLREQQAGASAVLVSPAKHVEPPAPPAPPAQENENDDIDGRVTLEYKDRVGLVSFLFAERFPELSWGEKKKDRVVSVALDEKETEDVLGLPPAGDTMPILFDRAVREFTGEAGCFRGKGHRMQALEVKNFPNRFKPKMDKFYKVFDCPWSLSALDKPNVMGSTAYVSSARTEEAKKQDFPIMKVKEKQLKDWEASDREMLSIMNFSDWFVASVKGLLDKSMHVLEDKEELSFEDRQEMWNDLGECYSLLDSVARCNQDSTKLAIDRIASMVITRRDSWLDRLSSDLDSRLKLEMRYESLNQELLFSDEIIARAKKAVKDDKHDRVQDQLLAQAANAAKNKPSGGGAPPRGGGRGGGGGKKFAARDQSERSGKKFSEEFQVQQDKGAGKNKFAPRPPRGRGKGRGAGNGGKYQ